jgi:outer membrane lipoprotein-sorting protein
MKTFLMTVAFGLMGLMTVAQDQDPKAKAILDELSKKTKGYTTLEVEFTMKTVNKTENVNESFTGKAKMKGNKYTVDLGKQKILCDGVKIWTLLIKEKECHESLVEDAEDDALNPTKMLTIWEKGFKFRLVKDENGIQEINLVPTNPGKAKYHTVVVKVDKAKQQVKTVIVKGKNGDVTTLEVTKFTPNVPVEDADFKFNKKDYPGYTIID